jgi:hypothetical protein
VVKGVIYENGKSFRDIRDLPDLLILTATLNAHRLAVGFLPGAQYNRCGNL